MGRRSRSRSRGGRNWLQTALLALLVVGAVAGAGTPAASFTVGSVERDANIDVVKDENGILTLDIASNLTAGTQQRLVNVTNYVDRPVDVTVTLKNESYGYLLDGDETDDSVTFHLDTQGKQQIDIHLNCDPDVGTNVTFRIQIDEPGFEADLNRTVEVSKTQCSPARLVYVVPGALLDQKTDQLYSVTNGTDPRSYTATGVGVIGPQAVNFDGDSALEIPYVNGNGELTLIDKNDEKQTLATSGIPTSKSLLWAGTWNGTKAAVYYANESNKNIYRVRPGHAPELVSSDAKAKAVAGAADIDGDDGKELVYVGGSGGVKYLTGEGETRDTGQGVGSNNGYGIGEPADFDGDGVARIPIVTGSNNVALVSADGTVTKLGGSAEKTTVASYDWDNDGTQEIMFLDKSDHILKFVDGLADGAGSVTIETARDGSGNTVEAEQGPGTA